MKVVEKFQDMAGKWRVRVVMDDESAVFVKFDHDPSDEEAIEAAAKYAAIEAENQSAEVIDLDSIVSQQTDLIANLLCYIAELERSKIQ